jgi:hypothetical protein
VILFLSLYPQLALHRSEASVKRAVAPAQSTLRGSGYEGFTPYAPIAHTSPAHASPATRLTRASAAADQARHY